jgi:hypothetical protein
MTRHLATLRPGRPWRAAPQRHLPGPSGAIPAVGLFRRWRVPACRWPSPSRTRPRRLAVGRRLAHCQGEDGALEWVHPPPNLLPAAFAIVNAPPPPPRPRHAPPPCRRLACHSSRESRRTAPARRFHRSARGRPRPAPPPPPPTQRCLCDVVAPHHIFSGFDAVRL